MKYTAKHYFFILALACVLFLNSPFLHAHGRYLRNAAKKAAKNAQPGTPALRLKSAQRAAIENQSAALQQVRRELIRLPNLLHNKDFQPQLDLLKQMNVTSADNPDAQTLFNQISQAQESLAPYIVNQPFPLRFSIPAAQSESPYLRSCTVWDAYRQARLNKQDRFSWKTADNQHTISMGPASFPSNPQHPLYPCGQLAQELMKKRHAALSDVFDAIFISHHLTSSQKLALARHISQTAELAGPDITLFYMSAYKKIPAVKMKGWKPDPMGKELLTYIRHKEAHLIEQLNTGSSWTENETNLFLDLAALLPQEEGRTLLGALTYLGPAAAQYLLLNPNPYLRKTMQTKIKLVREKGIPAWGTMSPEETPSKIVRAHIKFLRKLIAEHNLRLEKIRSRLENFEFAQNQLAKTTYAHPTLDNISQELYTRAYYMRLKNLFNKVDNYLDDIEAELNSLESFFPQLEE